MGNKRNSTLFLVILLGSLSAFGPFITDLYLPALPQLGEYFSASTSMVQLSLTATMIGLSVGQLFLGPISDKFGRKMPLVISLMVYTLSSIFIVFVPNIETLVVLRVIQGFSSAGSVVISRAIATDLYRGKEMARFFGLLMSVNGLAPIISPIIGSILLEFMDWRGIFVALALLGIFLLLACLRLYESLPTEKRLQSSVLASFSTLGKILQNRTFMIFISLQSLLIAAFFAYLGSSAFIFQQFYGLNAFMYSLCFSVNGIGMIIGVNLVNKMDSRRGLDIGILGSFIGAIVITFLLLIQANVWLIEGGFFLMLFFVGFVLPSSSALAMESERQYAGSASAVLGFCPFFLGGIAMPLVGVGDIFIATSAVLIGFAGLATLIYLFTRKQIIN